MRSAKCGMRNAEWSTKASASREPAGGMATRRCVAMWSKRSLLRRAAGSNLGRHRRACFFSICNLKSAICNPVAAQSAIRNPQSAIILPFNPQFAIRNPQSRV